VYGGFFAVPELRGDGVAGLCAVRLLSVGAGTRSLPGLLWSGISRDEVLSGLWQQDFPAGFGARPHLAVPALRDIITVGLDCGCAGRRM